MGNEETLSKEEIIRLIEDGDRYASVKFEELKENFKTIMETYDLLDLKIDRLEVKLDTKINLLFEDNQRFFDELRAMRREMSGKQQESLL